MDPVNAGNTPATPQAPAAGAPAGVPAEPAPAVVPAATPAVTPAATPAPAVTPAVTPASTPLDPGTPPASTPGDPAAAAAAAEAANKLAQQETPWYQELPAEQHEALKDFATPAEAVAAIEVGRKFTIAKTVEDYTFTFSDPAVDQNDPAIVGYKQFCLDNSISPEQAQKSLEYQTGLVSAANVQAKAAGEAKLRADWGNEFDVNLVASLTALSAVDAATGGTLKAKLNAVGGGNDPDILKALHWVSQKIGEDNLGAGGPGGTPSGKVISTEEAYAEMFGKAK